MTAETMFSLIGYVAMEKNSDEIQYVKQDSIEEYKRVGMQNKVIIEFYNKTKEILMENSITFKDGKIVPTALVLSFNEYLAIQRQINELGWSNIGNEQAYSCKVCRDVKVVKLDEYSKCNPEGYIGDGPCPYCSKD